MRDLFESTIERLLADLCTTEAVLASDGGNWPAALWRAIEDSGFALAAAPEAGGGAGASWHDLHPVLLACGRHNLPAPLPEAMLANWLLARVGLEPVDGPLSFTASPLATLENGRLRGRLADVPWGRHAEHVVAVVGVETPTVVLLATAGRACARQLNVAGEPRDHLDFDNAAVVAQAPLPDGLSPDVMLQGGALLRSVQTAGALQALLEMTTKHATERVQFGKPIGGFQAIQHQIAVLAEHTALACVAAEAACDGSRLDFATLPLATAKVCSAEAAGIAAGIAHAVHGAIGFTREHALHLSTRRLWAWRSEYGSQTVWAQRIGRATCAGGSAALWPAITSGRFEHWA
jgi:acyl-CoA dehydrogenase